MKTKEEGGCVISSIKYNTLQEKYSRVISADLSIEPIQIPNLIFLLVYDHEFQSASNFFGIRGYYGVKALGVSMGRPLLRWRCSRAFLFQDAEALSQRQFLTFLTDRKHQVFF